MEEEILEQEEAFKEPIVYKKVESEEGQYQDKDGKRYDILTCRHTESREWYDTGEVDKEGNPIWAERIVINKDWDNFESLEQAMEAYGLTPYVEPEENKE